MNKTRITESFVKGGVKRQRVIRLSEKKVLNDKTDSLLCGEGHAERVRGVR